MILASLTLAALPALSAVPATSVHPVPPVPTVPTVPTAPTPARDDDGGKVDYDAVLAQARERYGLPADLSGTTVDSLLDSVHFLRVDLGVFDVRLPVHAVVEKDGAALVREAAGYMLDLLGVWAEWTLEPDRAEEVADDVARVKKWLKGWTHRNFKKALDGTGDLYERMGADGEVIAAAERLSATLTPVREVESVPSRARIVLAPTRQTFGELSTLAGVLEPDRKSVLWADDAIFYSGAWSRDVQFVALEYPAWPWDRAHPFHGDSMNVMEKTGREQHVVDRAAESLTRTVFDAIASPLAEQAMRVDLVIAVVGEEHPTFSTWSFQWSRAGGSTQPYSRFVPGAPPAGGTLPARKAQAGPTSSTSDGTLVSPYRENDGRDHYREALADGQKKGAKLIGRDAELPDELRRDKRAHFAVGVLGQGDETAVTAPFLGERSENKPLPPNEFIDEYEEFFRAYRACFLHWLRTQGHPDGKAASPAAFRVFVERLRHRSATDTLSSMVQEVYGLPLSGPDGSVDSLEWRFLDWLK